MELKLLKYGSSDYNYTIEIKHIPKWQEGIISPNSENREHMSY